MCVCLCVLPAHISSWGELVNKKQKFSPAINLPSVYSVTISRATSLFSLLSGKVLTAFMEMMKESGDERIMME